MNAFITMLMLVDMHYYFLQSYVNMVFRHDWRPPSFSLISRVSSCISWFINLAMNPTFLALYTIVDLGMNMVYWSLLINLYGSRKFGNHYVRMEVRIWCKYCFVFIPSYHLHARLHSRTNIRIFARLTMPQVKILGMSWFVGIGWIGWVFPTVTSGVLCA
jgi:hypothetical protein